MATMEHKANLVSRFNAQLEKANEVFKTGTPAEFEAEVNKLKTIETEYKNAVEAEFFDSCNDVHDALTKFSFDTITHKKVSKDNVQTGIEKGTKTVPVDLRKFCDRKGFGNEWYYELQRLNKRLTLKVATELGCTSAEIKTIDDSYKMAELLKMSEMGKTPTSNTACIAHMQKVLDTLSEREGKVLNADLAYILFCYAKRDKKGLGVVCSNHKTLQALMTEVFHRIATGKHYSVDYKGKYKETTKKTDEVKTEETKTDSGKTTKGSGKGSRSKRTSKKTDITTVETKAA